MPTFSWRVFTIFYKFSPFCLKSFPLCFLVFFEGFFLPFVSLGLRIGCGRRRSSFSSLTTAHVSLYKFVMTETTWVSLFLNVVHVHSTENTLTLSSQRRLSFLFELLETDPFSTTSFQTLKFRVLIVWSIWSFTDVFNRKELVCPLFRTVPCSYKAKTVWSWTETSNFLTCTILPGHTRLLIIEFHPIERRNLGRRQSADVYWTNLVLSRCTEMLLDHPCNLSPS